jgi:two-component system, NtrC family, sensor histidine kinase AtoS
MNRNGPVSNRSASSIKIPAWELLTIMINQIPQEALVLDELRSRAVLANQAFLDMAGISASDLTMKALVDVYPGLEWVQTINSGKMIELRRGPKKIIRLVQTLPVDKENEFRLILLSPPEDEESQKLSAEKSQNYLKLLQLAEAETVEECYQIGLEVLKSFTGAKMLAVYRAEGDFPRFSRVASTSWEGEFPQSIAAVQSLMQDGTQLWCCGNRTTNELQRFAMRSGCNYMAIKLVGQPGAGLGLLVAADDAAETPERIKDSIEVVGTSLGHALQSILLESHLRQQVAETNHKLLFRQYMYENSPEGIFLLDENLNILECNTASEWMLGYSSAEVWNKSIESVLIGPDPLLVALEDARKGIPTHNSGVLHLNRRDGDTLSAQLQILPIMYDSILEGVVVFVQDVSENEQIRARTQQLENRALIGEFTAIFAHEVGNPINNIYAALQNMAVMMPEDDPQAQRVQQCLSECNRLKSLMTSVLDFARPLEPHFESVDVGMLVNRMMDRWRPKMTNGNITPRVQIAEDVPHIQADPRLLDQVFTNLISNAISAMAENEQGTLAIRVKLDKDVTNLSQVEISITDDGPGIPEEILAHIFEPFVSKRKGGTGLGLAIVKRIITSHHGTISAQSFTPGTIFSIKIPITPNGG